MPSVLSSALAIHSLKSLDYDGACSKLERSGYLHLADGDWARVFRSPDAPKVVRITPYDPAYRAFAECCLEHPHPNLPKITNFTCLDKKGYAVELPMFTAGELANRQQFLGEIKDALNNGSPRNLRLTALCQIISEGLNIGRRIVPYFAGIDWNVDNIMFDGDVPILTDAFYQDGPTITARLKNQEKLDLSEEDIQAFLKIPFQRKNPIWS